MIEGGEQADSALWRTTINSYDIALRIIERGFIHGTLTIENRAARITRSGTKGMTNQRGKGKADGRGRRGRWMYYIHARPLLYSQISVSTTR